VRRSGLGHIVKAALLSAALAVSAGAQTAELSQPAQIERVFQAGLSALETGNAAQAVVSFSAILASDPTLTRVRLELGRAYFAAGEYRRARAEFLTALSGDLPAPVRARVLAFIREIDARRGFEWSAEIGLTQAGDTTRYDTNAIDLDFGGGALPFELNRRDERRLGLSYRLEGTLRRAAGTGSVFASAALNGIEAPGRDLDETRLSFRTGYRGTASLATFNIALEGTTQFEAGDRTEDRYGLDLAAERRFARGQTVFGGLRLGQIDHQFDNTLDGTETTFRLGTQRPFSSRGALGAELLLARVNVDNPLENARRTGLRLFATLDVAGGFTLRPGLLFEWRDILTPSPLLTGDPNERSVEANLRVEKNDMFLTGGFSPFVQISARRTKSGVDAFSYRSSSVNFGLENRC